jgi:hypothetical protein
LTDGNDVAPWQADPGRELTGTAMVQWISDNNMDSIYGGANAFNNANFGYNNIQQYVATYSHKFNEKVWTTTEGWYMFQRNATTAPTQDVPYQNGAFPVSPGFVHEWAFLNYTMWRIGPGLFFTVRNEVFDDAEGTAPVTPRYIPNIPSDLPGGRTSSSPSVRNSVTSTRMPWNLRQRHAQKPGHRAD